MTQGECPLMVQHQYPLPLPLGRTAHGREDFLLAPCNMSAVAMLDRWPDWPNKALLISGPAGSGKSHLAEVWRQVSLARLVLGPNLVFENLPALLSAPGLILDEADCCDEQTLFHLLSFTRADGAGLLLFSRLAPPVWPIRRDDLASRIRSLAWAKLDEPDETLLAQLLVKRLSDRQIAPVSADIIRYVIERTERSYRAIERVAERLDHESLGRKKGLTIAVARDVMRDLALGLSQS